MKKSFFKKTSAKIIGGLLILGFIAGVFLVIRSKDNVSSAESPTLQTSKVRTSNLVVSAAGSGNILSSAQVELGFRTSGIVAQVFVTSGQKVQKGDTLASLDNTSQQMAFTQAEARLDNLFSPAGIASYQIDVVNSEIAYNYALNQVYTIGNTIGSTDYILTLRGAVATASENVINAEEKYNRYIEAADDDIRKVQALASLAQARINLDTTQKTLGYYENIPDTQTSTTITANLDLAEAQLKDAQKALEILTSGNRNNLIESLEAIDGTSLDKLKMEYLGFENARIALENTKLIAPFDGVIVNIDLVPGQTVGTSPVLTLAVMDKMQVKFYMDETDLAGLSLGNRALYTINAYPESILSGEVTLIEQSLQIIDGSPVVVVWGSLAENPSYQLLSGMTVDVEVIAGEAQNALIIPVQALRELAPNSYAVFVVQPDGSLKLTPVSIGLRDFANVEILSGLKAGDIVSTGTIETK